MEIFSKKPEPLNLAHFLGGRFRTGGSSCGTFASGPRHRSLATMSDVAPDSEERRAAPRFEIMAQVRTKRGRVDYVMDIINISRSGVLMDLGDIERPSWLKVGREILFVLFLDGDVETLDLEGKVVRIVEEEQSSHFAVQYVDLTAETRARLESFFTRAGVENAGPPPLPPST